MSQRENRRKFLVGKVVSDKMQKTCVVRIDDRTKHSLYLKPVKRAVKFKVHDEKNEAKIGDVVKIMETRPLSKDKRWTIREIISQGEQE